jgi:hypothetical protein
MLTTLAQIADLPTDLSPIPTGATAILALTVILVLTGKLVPIAILRKLERAMEEKDVTIATLLKQNDALIERVEMPVRVLDSIRKAAADRDTKEPQEKS